MNSFDSDLYEDYNGGATTTAINKAEKTNRALIIVTVFSVILAVVLIIIIIVLAVMLAKKNENFIEKENFSISGTPVYDWTTKVQTQPASLVKDANMRIGALGTVSSLGPAPGVRSLYTPSNSTDGKTLQNIVNTRNSSDKYYDEPVIMANKPNITPPNKVPTAYINRDDIITPTSIKGLENNTISNL